MTAWEQWVHRPQSHWVRKALFQVHLWSGICLGLYVIVISVTGSAAVFNSELYAAFLPKPKYVAIAGTRMNRTQLRAAAQRVYPSASIGRVLDYRNAGEAVIVTLGTDVNADQRFFDPYTGKDLGNARPFGLRMVSYVSQLHMNLMMGYAGRLMNGAGGFFTAALCLTGLILWWPGLRRWRRSLTVRFDTYPKRVNWDLHNAVGFWTFAIAFMWAVTGGYLVFPGPFAKAITLIAGHNANVDRMVHDLHVGNFAGWPVKTLWVVLGLTPALQVVTGFVMWWNRVLRPSFAHRPEPEPQRIPASSTYTPA